MKYYPFLSLCSILLSSVVISFVPADAYNGGVVISELHRDPFGSESAMPGGRSHEFIEITNLGADTFFIDSLFISDGVESDSVIAMRSKIPGHEQCLVQQRFLAPGQVALILDPDYAHAAQEYPLSRFAIKEGTVLFCNGDAELGGNGLAGNDGILLYKGTKQRMDTCIFFASEALPAPASPLEGKIYLAEPVNREGVSVVLSRFLFTTVQFDYCADMVSPGWFELVKDGFITEWELSLNSDQVVACSIMCFQTRAQFTRQVPWVLVSVLPQATTIIKEGVMHFSERIVSMRIELPLDSVGYRFRVADKTEWQIDISGFILPGRSVRINELFPRALPEEPEWFELINTSTMPINLKDWQVGNSEDTVLLTADAYILEPGAYVVVAKNKEAVSIRYPGLHAVIQPPRWHTLNNSKDTLFVRSASGHVCDNVCYEQGWFRNWTSQSLERVQNSLDGCNASAWVVSSKPSPGGPNGALFWREVSSPKLEIGPIPFTPNNDGRDDLLSIRIALPASSDATVSVYCFDGRKVHTFTGPVQEQYLWDGRGNDGKAVPPGPIFVVAEIKVQEKRYLLRKKGVLWR